MKKLFLIRGLPGSGKTTLAEQLRYPVFEADQYFIDSETNEYKFDASKLKMAHKWCQLRVEHSMEDNIDTIVVSNTFTQEWEMDAYYELSKQYGYTVFSVIVENRHGGVNQHGVPEDKLQQMADRFEIKLK